MYTNYPIIITKIYKAPLTKTQQSSVLYNTMSVEYTKKNKSNMLKTKKVN